jgi:hypothetical protein
MRHKQMQPPRLLQANMLPRKLLPRLRSGQHRHTRPHEQNCLETPPPAIGARKTQQQNSITLLNMTKVEALKMDTSHHANHATQHEEQHTETENSQTQNKIVKKQ